MSWSDILKIVATAFASVGGAGAIIWALSSFFGKMWANKILEKQKAEYQKEIEEYKNALSCELEEVKARNEKLTYISKIQFDTEIGAIKNLTQASYKALVVCFTITPYNEDLLKNKKEMTARHNAYYKEFVESVNSFMDVFGSSMAFIEKDIARLYDDFLLLCREQFDDYNKFYRPETGIPVEYVGIFYDRDKSIEKTHNAVISAIKTYLKNIKVAE